MGDLGMGPMAAKPCGPPGPIGPKPAGKQRADGGWSAGGWRRARPATPNWGKRTSDLSDPNIYIYVYDVLFYNGSWRNPCCSCGAAARNKPIKITQQRTELGTGCPKVVFCPSLFISEFRTHKYKTKYRTSRRVQWGPSRV